MAERSSPACRLPLLRDERGEVTGSLGIIRDITEFRVLSQQLLQSERLATIGQLSTQIAHEIMNPLSSIKMNIRILSKRDGLSDNDRRRLEIANFEIDHLQKILQDIFDYSRTLQLNLSQEDVNEVLEKSLLMVQDRMEEKQVSVTKRFARRLPRVPMDLVRMMQVFTNLFLNAIQAVSRGGKVTVSTRLERKARSTLRADNSGGQRQGNLTRTTGIHLRTLLHNAKRRHRAWAHDREKDRGTA